MSAIDSKGMKRIWQSIEEIFDDPKLYSVIEFGEEPKKKRIKITKVSKNEATFLVVIGKPNYAEREFIRSHRDNDLRGVRWLRYKK